MSAGLESLAVDQFMYSKLAADSTLLAALAAGTSSLYAEIAPQGASFPFVLWGTLSAEDDEYANNDRIWCNCVVVVRGLAMQESFAGALKTIATRIDTVLHKQSGVATDGQVYACVRIRPFRMVETLPGGEQVRHLGGVYRLYVK